MEPLSTARAAISNRSPGARARAPRWEKSGSAARACYKVPDVDRRAFLALAIGPLLPAVLVRPAPGAGPVPRIGFLTFTESSEGLREAFRQGLRDLGYMEGQNIAVEWRAADGRPERARTLAAELVDAKVDVIVANLTPAVQAARDATRSIPIVMASAGDPVATGLVASLR